jgi:hypothetical protein
MVTKAKRQAAEKYLNKLVGQRLFSCFEAGFRQLFQAASGYSRHEKGEVALPFSDLL